MKTFVKTLGAVASLTAAISTALAALPDPGMQIDKGHTALVVTDPQNDFLSPQGVTWSVVGKNVEANNTVENIDALFTDAGGKSSEVAIGRHQTESIEATTMKEVHCVNRQRHVGRILADSVRKLLVGDDRMLR